MNEINEENNKNIKRELKYNNKIYNAHFYIDGNKLAIEITIDELKYSNKYDLDGLQKFRVFRQSENLSEAFDELNDLFDNEFSFEEKGNNLELIFPHKRHPTILLLNRVDDNIDISYDNLSPQMKKIIDNNELILGIDLGTTYSCASVMIDKNIIMIRNSLGSTTTPSFIAFLNKNEAYVGELAKLLPSNAKNVVYNIKRLIGKNIEQNEIKELMNILPFRLKKDEETNSLKIELNFQKDENNENIDDKSSDSQKSKGKKAEEVIIKEKEEKKDFYTEEICALILRKIIQDSEFFLSKKIGKEIIIKDCVITVPAYFNQKQREATLNSAIIAGLNVKTMINEPTAASLAYGLNSKGNAEKKIIVIDFGGGTLDITLLKYTKDKNGIYCNVLGTYGDTNFGGEDFDKILMTKCKEKLLDDKTLNTLVYKERFNSIRLKRACERAKIKLSKFKETKIHLENYVQYQSFDFLLKEEDFIEYCKDLFDKFEKILDDFLKKSKTDKNLIEEVILIGGSTLIPKINEIISNKFNKSKINCHLNPKEVVAMGAAIRGAITLKLSSIEEIQLFDVTNLSLGIKENDNNFDVLIKRSSKLPCEKIKQYKTQNDNQTMVLIEIYEGEDETISSGNNLLLGKFKLVGLPKKKQGDVKVKVKFKINENSILEVTAWEKENEVNRNQIKIEKLFNLDLDSLYHKLGELFFVENKEYDKIKFEIIELEEKVNKQKTQKKINVEALKLLNKNIITKIGNFLKGIKDYSNLHISYIKYYFNKICEYYQDNKRKSNDDINDLNNIKENIKLIFEAINSELIYEIIEEFVDFDEVYKSCIDFMLKIYYAKINAIFFSSNLVKKEKKSSIVQKTLKELSEGIKLADICIQLIDKCKLDKNNIINLNLKELENIKLKIKVREELIKDNNKSILKKIFTSNKEYLTNLFNQYYSCESHDKDDLQELKLLIGKKEIKIEENKIAENFEEEFQNAFTFNEWLTEQTTNLNGQNISNIITRILNEFPYSGDKDDDDMWNNFHLYKSGQERLDNYIMFLKGKYQRLFNDDNTNDVKKEVYEKILLFLNALEMQNN